MRSLLMMPCGGPAMTMIVIDPKGQLAAITARKRATMSRVVPLNPFGLFDEMPRLPPRLQQLSPTPRSGRRCLKTRKEPIK